MKVPALLFLLFVSVAHADTLPDPLQAGWQGRSVCEKIHETAKMRILRCTFPPGVGHERHFHPKHFGYALSGGTMRVTDASGTREAKLATLVKTKMCDWAEEARAEASGSGSAAEAKARRDATVEAHAALGKAAARAVKFASDGALIKNLRRDKAANAKFAAAKEQANAQLGDLAPLIAATGY